MSEAEEPDRVRLARDRIAVALLLAGALVRALVLAEVAWSGLELRQHTNIDAYHYHRRAIRDVAGDWANRERFEYNGRHPDEPDVPRQSLSILVFGEERYDALNGPATYYDYPGYPYFVAAFYELFGPDTKAVLAAQEALDLLACACVYLIALRLFDRRVARVALALVVFMEPTVFYAAFLLRDSLIASLNVFLVYLALRAKGPRGWLAAGFVLGLAWIVKGSVLALVPFFMPGARLRGAVALALGFALGVSPIVARNVALGAPPFRACCIEEASLITQNVPQESVRGLDYRSFAKAIEVGHRCDPPTKWNALRLAIAAHPSFGSFARQCAARTLEHYRADDAWDNVRESWLAPCLRSLRLAPVRWKLIEGFAAIGLVLALRDPKRTSAVLGPVAANAAMAAIGMALSRYRLTAEHFHALLAASAIVWMLDEARRKKPRALMAALGGVAVTLALHDAEPGPSRAQIAKHVRDTFGPVAAERLGCQ